MRKRRYPRSESGWHRRRQKAVVRNRVDATVSIPADRCGRRRTTLPLIAIALFSTCPRGMVGQDQSLSAKPGFMWHEHVESQASTHPASIALPPLFIARMPTSAAR
jgi:hypothetical protein